MPEYAHGVADGDRLLVWMLADDARQKRADGGMRPIPATAFRPALRQTVEGPPNEPAV
jgi:hypothetical protein